MNRIPAATIEHLTWSYRTKPLFHDLNTTFMQDAFIAIVGPNGSGKTTLLKHLLGAVVGQSGVVKLFNQPLHEYSQRRMAQRVSYVPQQSKLEYDFTVYECVAMGRYAHTGRLSMLQSEDHRLIHEALRSVELDHLRDRNAVELSGGEYQRMLIARALAQQASLIVLDEPVSHLDIHNQREILSLLRNLVDRKVATVLCVLHDLNAVSAYSDLIVMMQDGAIVAEGTVHDVLTKDRIESVYRIEVNIIEDPLTQRPLIIPQWRT